MRLLLGLVLLLLGGAAFAVEPTVTITAPANNSTFNVGSLVNFTAAATDAEDDDTILTSQITWSSDLDGALAGTGGGISTSSLSAGSHTITASVTDSELLLGTDSITVNVNAAPTVTITAPANNSDFDSGTSINFEAGATDAEDNDNPLSNQITWSSDVNGALGTGRSINVSTLSVGSHVITAAVTDSDGSPGSDSISVTINNTAPTITITGDNPASVLQGANYSDAGATASDAEDGNLTGSINTTGLPLNTAVAGLQVDAVTYEVTDSNGSSVQVTRDVNVLANTAPNITITGANPANVLQNTTYSDAGATASDAEDGNITGSINTTGLPVDTSVVGLQVVTYDVTDSDGNFVQVSRNVNVLANTVPNISITGANPANVLQNTTYSDAGATASDAEDGNITGSINTTGLPVDTSVVGLQVVTYDVTDSDGNFVQASRNVNVLANTVPIITITGDNPASVAEGDTYVDAGATASDAEDGNITGSINTTGLPVDTSVAGLKIVTYDVTDDDGNFVQVGRNVNVVGNNPPVLTPIGAQSVIEAAAIPLNISLGASDPDGDSVVFSTQNLPGFCTLTDAGNGTGSIVCSPTVGNDGTYNITVTVTDVTPSQKSDLELFTLTVDANQPPTASGVAIAITTDLDPSGVASLGDQLTGSYTYADAEDDVEGASTFRWLRDGAAIPGAVATTYTVTVDDIEANLTFEVTPVALTGALQGTAVASANLLIENTPPVIDGQTPLIETPEETPLEILLVTHVQASDAEDQSLTLTVLDSPDATPSYTRSGPDGNTITPALDLNGPITVPVTVNDGFDDSTVFNLQVTVTAVNDLPVFVGVVPPGLSTLEDTTLTIVLADLEIVDPDNLVPDEMVLTLLPPGATDEYTLAGDTSITPALNFNGQLLVAATVSDNAIPAGVSAPFLIPVDVDPVNDLPVLVTPIGPQQAIECRLGDVCPPWELDVSVNFSDDDIVDTLTYTADWSPSQPPNIAFDGVTGLFSGVPREIDSLAPGPIYTVIVTAMDPEGETVSDSFDLTINALGRANLNMTIDVAPATALPSEELRWTFTTNNPVGPVAGENVQITGSFIGAGITVTVVGAVNCTFDVQGAASRTDFTCDVGGVPVGGSPSIAFATSTTIATEIIAFGTAAGTQPVPIDPNEEDNSDIRAAGVAEAFSTMPVQDLGNTTIQSVAAGDVNGDGVADIVVGTASGQPVQVFFADALRESCNCQRDFLSVPISIPDTGANTGVALADFDGNGTLDLVVANNGDQADAVYSNDGNGNFTLAATLGPSNANDVAVGDFNNDGNMDIVVAASSPNLVYFGDGSGAFGIPRSLGDNDSRSVAVGRFDNNNRMD
ncbi:MAG: immunoglobulin-like domain-containing protein, partial [Woeseiaceae bacterium]